MHQSLHRWAEVSGKCSLFINKKLFFLSCLCAGLMAVPTTIDVMGSLLFHKALTCSTELVEFLQVVVLFGGLGYVHDKRAHVYVEMILDKMPETWRPAFRLAFIGAAAVLFTVMARQLFLTGLDRFSSGEVSYDLHIPEYIFVLFAALGTLAAVVSFVADIIGELASLLEKASLEQVPEDEFREFRSDLKRAETLVYLTDNCGEIVLDKLFTRHLKKEFPRLQITAMVRGSDVLNDATMEDAEATGLTALVPCIGNGSSAPGTVLKNLSSDARRLLLDADMIIAKGQGNFESLYGEGLNPYYFFLCKCELFVQRFGLKQFAPVFAREDRIFRMN